MTRIVQTFETDNKQSLQAIDRLNRELDKLVAQNKKLVEESKGSGDAALKAAGKQTQGLTRIQRELLKLAEAEKKRAAAAVKAGEDVAKAAERYTRDLEAQVATFGKGARALDLYKLQQRGASAETIKHAQALNKQLEALEKARKEKQKAAAADKSQRRVDDEGTAYARKLKAQIDTFGMGGRALDIYRLRQKGVSEETIKHIQALDKQLTGMEMAGQGFRGMFKGATAQFATMLAGYASIQGAIELMNRGLQDHIALQDKARDIQITGADAQIKLMRNLAGDERESTLAGVEQISKDTGVSQKIVTMVTSEAVSAKGNLTTKDALAAVREAVTIAPEDEGEATAIAGGILDAAYITGQSDAKKNLGFLLAIQKDSRVNNLASISQHLVPAIAGVRQHGDNAVDAAALTTAFTNVLVDKEGRMSGTGALQLSKQLEEFLPEHDQYGTNQFGRRVRIKRGTGLKDTAERRAFLLRNQTEREKFLANSSFEAKVDPFARALLTDPNSEVSRNYELLRRTLPTPDEAAPLTDQMVRSIQSQPIQQLAAKDRGRKQTSESIALKDARGAAVSSNASGIDEILGSAGRGYIQRLQAKALFYAQTELFGRDPDKAFIDVLNFDQTHGLPSAFGPFGKGGMFNPDSPEVKGEVANEMNRTLRHLLPKSPVEAEPRAIRELPQFEYSPPTEPARRARRMPITIGPSRQERRQSFDLPAAGDGASLAPATGRPLDDRQTPVLQEIADLMRRNNRLQEQAANQTPRDRDRGPLSVARSAVADRNRHVEG